LFAAAATAAVTWLVVLPRVGNQPALRAFIERNETLGVDPTAKFYTELPGMADFRDRTATARRQHAEAFGF